MKWLSIAKNAKDNMNQSTLEKIKLYLKDDKACKGRILIVDKLEIHRSSFSNILENHGYITATADCGFKAIEVLTFFHADLVVIDCSMRRLENLKCSEYIQKIDPNISIVFTSADASSELKILTFKAGGKDLIEKPFTGNTLKESIEKHLTNKLVEPNLDY